MEKKIPTEVYAEMTPNPATMKFATNRMLIEGGAQAEYINRSQAEASSPLALELFNFPFVTGVFISGNYVAVAKDESLGWEMIVMQLRDYIREWLELNPIAVSQIPEHKPAEERIELEASSEKKPFVNAKYGPSPYDDEIKQLLDDYVRPAVEQDGGAIDFSAFHEGKVYVQLRGACSGCPSSMQTLKGGIEQLLRAKLDVVEEVVAEAL